MKTFYKIGDVFQCGLIKLRVIDAKEVMGSCDHCACECGGENCMSDMTGPCRANERPDNKPVFFEKCEPWTLTYAGKLFTGTKMSYLLYFSEREAMDAANEFDCKAIRLSEIL